MPDATPSSPPPSAEGGAAGVGEGEEGETHEGLFQKSFENMLIAARGAAAKGGELLERGKGALLSDGWRMKGHCLCNLSDYKGSAEALRKALEISQAYGDLEQEGQVRIGLGSLALKAGAGDLAEAESQQTQAIQIGERVKNDGIICAASGNLGKIRMMQPGRAEEAVCSPPPACPTHRIALVCAAEACGSSACMLARSRTRHLIRRQVDLFRTAHGRSHGRSRVVQAINLGEAHFLTDDPDKNAAGLEWLRTARREAAAASLVDLTAAALRGLINQLTLLCEACASESSTPTAPPASEASVALGCRDTWLPEAFQCRCELRQVMERMRGTPQADECPISLQPLHESSLVVVLEVSP